MRQYGKNRFLISSRPYGYTANPLAGVSILQVRPLAPTQVRRFVENWYVANEIKRHGQDDPGVRLEAKSGADELLARLRSAHDLRQLTVNPLLLTMIATVHRFRGSLPGSRVELYCEICTVFLGRRRQALGLDFDLRSDQKQAVLEPLAYHMMCERTRAIATAQAITAIADALAAVRPNANGAEFLRGIANSSGILVERESGELAFSHLTFQEYLAAVHVRNNGLVKDLSRVVHNSWWHETLRLYVAQADGTPVIQACLSDERPGPEALAIAIQCLGDAKTIDPNLRQSFEAKIALGSEADTPEERRPICEALLHLRLTHMTSLDERLYISSNITNAEYQLFVDESLTSGFGRQPDHWLNLRFPKNRASSPIVGVRHSDVEAFCKWLTKRDKEGCSYDVPIAPKNNDTYHTLPDTPVGFWARLPDASGYVHVAKQAETDATAKRVFGSLTDAYDIDKHLAPQTAKALARALDIDYTNSRFDKPIRNAAWKRILERCRQFDFESALDLDSSLQIDHQGFDELLRGVSSAGTQEADFAITMDRGPDFDRALRLIRDRDLIQLAGKLGNRFSTDEILRFLCWYVRWFSILLLLRLELYAAPLGEKRHKTAHQTEITSAQNGLLRLIIGISILIIRCSDPSLPLASIVVVKSRGAGKLQTAAP